MTTEDGDGRVTSNRDDEHGCEFVHGAKPAAGVLHQVENEFREGQTNDVEACGRAPKSDLSALSPPRSRGERSRDSILRVLDGFTFRILNLVVLFLVVVDGALFLFLLIGAHGMCRRSCRRILTRQPPPPPPPPHSRFLPPLNPTGSIVHRMLST